jgi:hypothetical protein
MNRSRQRRAYQVLSNQWNGVVLRARQLPHELSQRMEYALGIQHYDCLIEAALAAWDLDLVAQWEEREAWWWLEYLCEARGKLAFLGGSGVASWEDSWALYLRYMAKAMQMVSCRNRNRTEISCSRIIRLLPRGVYRTRRRRERLSTCVINGRGGQSGVRMAWRNKSVGGQSMTIGYRQRGLWNTTK